MKRLVVHMTVDELQQLVSDSLFKVLAESGGTLIPKSPKYITRKDAANMLHVSLMTLNEWRKKSILSPRYIGGRALYSIDQIEKILNNEI